MFPAFFVQSVFLQINPTFGLSLFYLSDPTEVHILKVTSTSVGIKQSVINKKISKIDHEIQRAQRNVAINLLHQPPSPSCRTPSSSYPP